MSELFGLDGMSIMMGRSVRAIFERLWFAETHANELPLLGRLLRDEGGFSILIFVFLLPALIGVAALGTEGGLWLYTQQQLQASADSAAMSAARTYFLNPFATNANLTTQAEAVTATYGFVNGQNGVTVTVQNPPSAGTYEGKSNAIEVIVQQQKISPILTSYWFSKTVTISSSAIALIPQEYCVLALDPSAAGAVSVVGIAGIDLSGCGVFSDSSANFFLFDDSIEVFAGGITASNGGTVGAVGGVLDVGFINPSPTTGDAAVADPYASVTMPKPGTCVTGTSSTTPFTATTSTTISQGNYCGGMVLSGTPSKPITVTLNPGIYFLDEGSLTMNFATLTGTGGVTLVFTGSGTNYATMSVQNFSTINLVAPTSGATAGMVMFGDRSMPLTQANGSCNTFAFLSAANFCFDLASSLSATGVVYLPRGKVLFGVIAGDLSTSCTQIVADQVQLWGGAILAANCGSIATLPISNGAPQLVQ